MKNQATRFIRALKATACALRILARQTIPVRKNFDRELVCGQGDEEILKVRSDREEVKKIILIDLKKAQFFTYYFGLMKSLAAVGHTIVVRPRIKMLGNAGRFADLVRHISDLRFSATFNRARCDIIITDMLNDKMIPNVRVLRSDIFTSDKLYVKSQISILPFPMSPDVSVSANARVRLQKLRGKVRKKSLYFSGNTSAEAYSDVRLQQKFSVAHRCAIVERFLEASERSRLSERSVKINIAKWSRSNRAPKDVPNRVHDDGWLEELSEHAFFLCAPGVHMPFCHNLVEATAVGTIPVLEYGKLLPVPMQHGLNAIFIDEFDNVDDLLYYLDKLSTDEIDRISEGAARYYDENFSDEAVAKLIVESDGDVYFYNTPDAELWLHKEPSNCTIGHVISTGANNPAKRKSSP